MDYLTEVKEIERIINEGDDWGEEEKYELDAFYSPEFLKNKEIKKALYKFSHKVAVRKFSIEINKNLKKSVKNIRKAVGLIRKTGDKNSISKIEQIAKRFDDNIIKFGWAHADLQKLTDYMVHRAFEIDEKLSGENEIDENVTIEAIQDRRTGITVVGLGSALDNIPKMSGKCRWDFSFTKFSSEFNRSSRSHINDIKKAHGDFISFLKKMGDDGEEISRMKRLLSDILNKYRKYLGSASKDIKEIGRNIDEIIRTKC